MAEKMTLFESYLSAADELETLAARGLVVLGVVQYGLRGEEPSFDDSACRMAFKVIKPFIDTLKRQSEYKKDYRARTVRGQSEDSQRTGDGLNARYEIEQNKKKNNNNAQTEFALVSESSSKLEKTDPYPFEAFWEQYGKKVDRQKCEKKWAKLDETERAAVMAYLPGYIEATPDIKYRRDPSTFLNNRTWENDLPSHGETNGQTMPAPNVAHDDGIKYSDGEHFS